MGLEAQRETVRQFVASRGGRIIGPEFVEVETGKRNDRPELQDALKRCRLTGATLVVAKLDGKLQQLRVQVQRGIISDEQATKQRAIAIRETTDALAARRKVGQQVADALQSRIVGRAWPEAVPDGADRDLVRDELDHLERAGPHGRHQRQPHRHVRGEVGQHLPRVRQGG